MAFEKVDIKELVFSPVKAIGDDWGILTGSGERGFNSMTVSWGGVGVLWSRPVIFAFVRPHRYTYEFLEDGDMFSLAIMNKDIIRKVIMRLCCNIITHLWCIFFDYIKNFCVDKIVHSFDFRLWN